MDGEFFWVVMLVLYLIFQVLGGRKRKEKKKAQRRRAESATGRPPEVPRQPRPVTTADTSGRSPELDDALQEIRRALGFPDESSRRAEKQADAEARPLGAGTTTLRSTEKTGLETSRTTAAEAAPPIKRPVFKTPKPQRQPLPKPQRQSPPKPERQSLPKPQRLSPPKLERQSLPKPIRTPRHSASPIRGSISEEFREPRFTQIPMIERAVDGAPTPAADERAGTVTELSDAVRSRLRSPQSLREAFLLKEILDPPRSIRPFR